jgi:hypothetical protein
MWNGVPYRSPSFPHAFSGNPGDIRTGPPIKTFGGDTLEIIAWHVLLVPQFAAGFFKCGACDATDGVVGKQERSHGLTFK